MYLHTLFIWLLSTSVLSLKSQAVVTDLTQAANQACLSIQHDLGSDVVQRSASQEYNVTIADTWNLYNQMYHPTCIVYPRTAVHVQIAMKAIHSTGSHYAVQAGAHSGMKGWNTVQAGVLIAFSHMQGVSYNSNTDTITLQPGVHWADAITQLQSEGVAPVGGRQGVVGTGLLLGGGLSFLTPSHGLAADSIISADVVLTSGELVTATRNNTHSDLFRALKGGGNRFGIVVQYEVEAVHTGTNDDKRWYGGQIIYPNTSIEAVIKAMAKYVREVNDPNAVILTSIVASKTPFIPNDPNSSTFAFVSPFYLGANGSLPESIFGPLLKIPAISTTLEPLSYADITRILPPDQTGVAQHFGGTTLLGDEDVFLENYARHAEFSARMLNASMLDSAVFVITPFSQFSINYGRERGGNAVNPPNGPFAYIAVEITKTVIAETKLDMLLESEFSSLLSRMPPSRGKPLFLNECYKKQDVFGTYSGGNGRKFLQDVYARYDPGRFNIKHTEGPIGL